MSWPNIAIGDVALFSRSSVAPEKIESGTTYVGLEHIDSSGNFVGVSEVSAGELGSSKFRFGKEHVLFGKLRPYLRKTARPEFDGICSTDILPLRPTEKVDRDYLFHALRVQSFVDEVSARATGVNLPRVSPAVLAKVKIPLPPLPEQRRIAAILDKADALRAKRREAIAKLDQLLQSVFLDMFGDPVTNPKGWSQKELHEICDPDDRVNYGVVQPGDEFAGGVPLIRVGDIDGGKLNVSSIKRIDPVIEGAYGRSRLRGNELLVSCVGSIGTIASVPDVAKGYNIARAITRVPLANHQNRSFVRECLRSPGVQRYFAEKTRTVSQPTLNVSFVKSVPVICPPPSLISKFCELAETIENKMRSFICSGEKLADLFEALQKSAFSGQLARNG